MSANELMIVIFKKELPFLMSPIFDDYTFEATMHVTRERMHAVSMILVRNLIHFMFSVCPKECYREPIIPVTRIDGSIFMKCEEWTRASMLMWKLVVSGMVITDDNNWLTNIRNHDPRNFV